MNPTLLPLRNVARGPLRGLRAPFSLDARKLLLHSHAVIGQRIVKRFVVYHVSDILRWRARVLYHASDILKMWQDSVADLSQLCRMAAPLSPSANGTHDHRALVLWLREHAPYPPSPIARKRAAKLVERAVRLIEQGYTWREVYEDFLERLPSTDGDGRAGRDGIVSLRTLQRYVAAASGGSTR
jgi:hypothetical protein